MKAVILAGGYATRLRPISYVIPKLLFPVVGKPIIYWTLDMLRNFGVEEVVLGVNYLADMLKEKVGTSYRNMKIRYSFEEVPLGTAGPLRLAAEVTRLDRTFLALNGDVIVKLDLARMYEYHEQTGVSVTDALHEVKNTRRFGVAELDSEWRIKRFLEKPRRSATSSHLVNAGIYLIEPEVLEKIPADRKVSLERQIFPSLARRRRLGGFPFAGFWFDIGDLADYRRTNFSLLQTVSKRSVRAGGPNAAANVNLTEPLYLGEGTRVERDASIGPLALVGQNGVLEKGSRIWKSVLFDDVTVGEGSIVSGAVLASNVKLGKGVMIGEDCVVSSNVTIADHVRIGRGTVIHPYKEIAANVKAGSHIL